jgi:hypothetical protein
MPTVTIDRAVTIEDTTQALQQKLGDGYERPPTDREPQKP